ncbi:MAG: hypothetical protein INH43_16075 [Acidobacteriaceae bacterium]|nr:hypothetical protein [Acidobacteriaceae bacterium]
MDTGYYLPPAPAQFHRYWAPIRRRAHRTSLDPPRSPGTLSPIPPTSLK